MATNKILTVEADILPKISSTTSYLQPTGFKLVMDRRNYPNLEYFAQSIIHPSLSVPAAEQSYMGVSSLSFSGDKLQFTQLTCTLIMDEDMMGYEEILLSNKSIRYMITIDVANPIKIPIK